VGPVFAGYVFDITGSYRFAFLVFVLLAVLSGIFF
jgi:cyanate permease